MIKVIMFAAAACLLSAAATSAQTGWSGTWKIVNGRCIDGLKVDAKEEPGVLVVTIHGNDRFRTSERRVALRPDGSGKTTYDSATFGPLELAVAAGSGRRDLTLTQQQKGICQWKLTTNAGNQ